MNRVLQAIDSRRSTGAYRPEPLKAEELDTILEAGLYAPSACNGQPWHFTVVHDRALLDHMSEVCKAGMAAGGQDWMGSMAKNPEFHVFYRAPLAVVVSESKDGLCPLVDTSAAIQNMLLAAESLGIGSCWLGLARFFFASPQEVRKLDIPEGYDPLYAVSLGYKAGLDAPAPARKGRPIRHLYAPKA